MPEVVEHAAEPAGALGPRAVGGALEAGGRGGDDLLVEEQLLGPPEEVRERERDVLHQALHGAIPPGVGRVRGGHCRRCQTRRPWRPTTGTDPAERTTRAASPSRSSALIVMNNVGTALRTEWAERHPLLLIALNSQNRNLILATNQLDAWSYYVVGTLRLLRRPTRSSSSSATGTATPRSTWLERRTKTFGQMLRQWEGVLRRRPRTRSSSSPRTTRICLFAGAAGMSVTGFFVANMAGTIARLYLIRRLGEAFEEPHRRRPRLHPRLPDAAADRVDRHRRRASSSLELRGGTGLDELEEMVEEDEGGSEAPAEEPAPDEHPG